MAIRAAAACRPPEFLLRRSRAVHGELSAMAAAAELLDALVAMAAGAVLSAPERATSRAQNASS